MCVTICAVLCTPHHYYILYMTDFCFHSKMLIHSSQLSQLKISIINVSLRITISTQNLQIKFSVNQQIAMFMNEEKTTV